MHISYIHDNSEGKKWENIVIEKKPNKNIGLGCKPKNIGCKNKQATVK